MTAYSSTTLPRRTGVRARVRAAWWRQVRAGSPLANRTLLGLVGAVTLVALCAVLWPTRTPVATTIIPLVIAAVTQRPREQSLFAAYSLLCVAVAFAAQEEYTFRTNLVFATHAVMCVLVLVLARRRVALGVSGAEGELMFLDLRDRILSQGRLPALPPGWHAEIAIRSAGGTPFAGDFVLVDDDPGRLDVALVDVSGKGEKAGARALQLAGAFGGLLRALDPEEFLPAANDYLLHQRWEEGFATAVHVSVDLVTGDFAVRSAGHPPALQLRRAPDGAAAPPAWSRLDSAGPILGLVEEAEFVVASGRLDRGDALLLYTDGLVEVAGRDIDEGVEALAAADALARGGEVARRVVDEQGSRHDDRALLVISRP